MTFNNINNIINIYIFNNLDKIFTVTSNANIRIKTINFNL